MTKNYAIIALIICNALANQSTNLCDKCAESSVILQDSHKKSQNLDDSAPPHFSV